MYRQPSALKVAAIVRMACSAYSLWLHTHHKTVIVAGKARGHLEPLNTVDRAKSIISTIETTSILRSWICYYDHLPPRMHACSWICDCDHLPPRMHACSWICYCDHLPPRMHACSCKGAEAPYARAALNVSLQQQAASTGVLQVGRMTWRPLMVPGSVRAAGSFEQLTDRYKHLAENY
jgi:hypothetical protein